MNGYLFVFVKTMDFVINNIGSCVANTLTYGSSIYYISAGTYNISSTINLSGNITAIGGGTTFSYISSSITPWPSSITWPGTDDKNYKIEAEESIIMDAPKIKIPVMSDSGKRYFMTIHDYINMMIALSGNALTNQMIEKYLMAEEL